MTTAPGSAALAGKNLAIVGGTSGIGLSAAKAFLREGARLVVVGLRSEQEDLAQAELGSAAIVIFGDATEPGTAVLAIRRAVTTFGRLDGLYHVAGGSGRRRGDGPLHETTDEGWQTTVDLNLTSVFYSNRAAVRQFVEQKSPGSILNLTSVLAWSPSPRHFATHGYSTAKAGIIGLTRACAAYYAPQGIRFNALAPGLVATPMSRRAQEDPAISEFIRTKQPLEGGRIGQPGDLDAAAVFFMSDASRFATGQVLAVDGGWSVTEGQHAAAQDISAGDSGDSAVRARAKTDGGMAGGPSEPADDSLGAATQPGCRGTEGQRV